jgi:hypothetical protein
MIEVVQLSSLVRQLNPALVLVRTAEIYRYPSDPFLEMEPQDGIALVKIELMGPAVLNIGVQLDRFALVSGSPLLDTVKKIFAYSPGPQIGVHDNIVDFELFA